MGCFYNLKTGLGIWIWLTMWGGGAGSANQAKESIHPSGCTAPKKVYITEETSTRLFYSMNNFITKK